MAEEAPNTTMEQVVPSDVPQPHKLQPDSENDNNQKMPEPGSFKEESTKVSDLPDHEMKALHDLKLLVQQALDNHDFSASLNPPPPKEQKPETFAVDKNDDDDDNDEEKREPVEEIGPKAASDVAQAEPTEPTKTEEETDKTEPAQVVVEDDGEKTVEAIEESVVAVPSSVPPAEAETKEVKQEEVSIWGIPLLADERSDVILLKFLRARDFKVKEAFAMIKNTIRWRKEFGIEELMDEKNKNLGDHLEKVVYMHGFDKEGHPVCYNIYGEFQNKELYKNTFSDEEKREKFLRWRIQFLEKSIRKLDFTPGGISTIVQVSDLKNSPGPGKWELRHATKQALQLLQDNYPEFVAKQVFINVPWWYMAVNRMISPFLTQRTKSKFVFAGPSKSAVTLLRYIAAEQLPVKYGGLSKDGEVGNTDAVTEITVRPAVKHTVEFPVTEKCLLSWELRVIGWDVSYGAEFVPSSEGSYTVIIQKARKVASSGEPVVCDSFQVGEPGKVVLTIDNPSTKKKKLLYRLKNKPSSD